MTPALVDLVESINIVMGKSINTSKDNVIQVAVGIITNPEGQLLVAKRPQHWMGGGFWEFPGGKIEPNEDSKGALKRELLEEVGITVHQCSPLIRLAYEYPERIVILHAWNIESYTGIASGLEGQEISWREPNSLNQLNMLPANRAIVTATKLPDTYLITPDFEADNFSLSVLEKKLLQRKIKILQLRATALAGPDYVDLANKILPLCRRLNVSLILSHFDLDIIQDLDSDGIHLLPEQVASLEKRPIPRSKWLATTCRNVEQIIKAEKIDVDFLLLEKEIEGFEELISRANIPLYVYQTSKDYVDAIRFLWDGATNSFILQALW